ncbi:hypothetical protein BMS3Bbin09_00852 [bacterium BMS3Bbin09]|nr:hypothetical protein BMS3Bbin09_00852 [bacterium BMS3Bbin09]
MKTSAHDVARYILNKQGKMTAMKLQKLLYYCQAWSLVWDDAPIFHERIEAWANGPVVRAIYNDHAGLFSLTRWKHGKVANLSLDQKETIDSVLKYYGKKTSQWLSELTHKETPWKIAREGLTPNQRGSKAITHASMAEYYSSL